MIPRTLAPTLLRLAKGFPILTLTGPRQSGKTTLCKATFPHLTYVSLEAPDTRRYAREDPRGFLSSLASGAILDEIQRAPELTSYLQVMVDEDPSPGRFVLTGSEHLSLTAATSQSLAGRTAVVHLLPLDQAELRAAGHEDDDLLTRLGSAGYAARAGIAETPGAAWAVARHSTRGTESRHGVPRKENDLTIIAPGETRAALEQLPVAALRLTPKTIAALRTLGLHHVDDLLKLPRAALAARFGRELAVRLDAALGDRPEPLSPLPPPVIHFTRMAFPEPVGLTDGIAQAIRRLLDELCAGLELAGDGARGLVLALFEPDGKYRRIEVRASRSSRDAAHLACLFETHLDSIDAPFGIEAITLAAPGAEKMNRIQAGLITDEDRTRSEDETNQLIDRLANRLGAAHVVRFAAHESHIPERAQRIIPALDGPRKPDHAGWPVEARPIRLLSRPESVEVMAPVPDDPPVMFRWRHVLHRVARADGPERITPEWWLAGNDSSGGGASDGARLRDYYRVEDNKGRRFWLYREGLYRPDAPPAWFLHGIFE